MSSDGSSRLTAPEVPSSSEFACSGLRGVDLPNELRRHRLVAGRRFYTVPLELWKGFHGAVRITQLDHEIAAVDRALSEFAESIDGCVGFADGVPIVDWLVRPPAPLDDQLPAVQGYLEECRQANIRVDDVVPNAKRRFALQRVAQQGYLGWLLTNPDFLNELREFWQTFSDLGQDGRAVPVGIALQAQAGRSSPKTTRDPESDPVAHLVDAFGRRWRLSQVVAPLTLRPLGVQFPAPLPLLSAGHAQTSGALLFIPDIAPLPDRNELRLMMEEVVRQTTRTSPHLGEWFELVLADNQGRKTLHSYARCLPLQHYLRVLHGRYGDQLQGSHQRVEQAVARFLRLTEHQMRLSVRSIRNRLGANWLDPADCQVWST